MSSDSFQPTSWIRRRVLSLPRFAGRDRTIADLTAERDTAEAALADARRQLKREKKTADGEVDIPSFRRTIYAERRIAGHSAHVRERDRPNIVTHKLRSYSFAQSWGVDVPRLHAVWDTLDEIALDDLPDEVVVKSIGGAGGRGVLPLRRGPGGWTVASEGGVLTADDVRERFRALEAGGKVDPPYFAEEFLGTADVLPADVKVSAFFGEVSHVLLRTVGTHGDASSIRFRLVLPDRSDIGDVLGPGFPHGPDIPIPDTFDQLIEQAATLSRAIPRPYIRVDLYDVGGRIVFGELTPRPGGPQVLGVEQDARLGHYWERAQARLTDHLVDGGDLGLRFGPGSRDLAIGSSGSRRFVVPYPQ